MKNNRIGTKPIIFTILFLLNFSVVFSQNPNFHWAAAISSTDAVTALSVVTDSAGNVYTAGEFTGITDFDPGAGTFTLAPSGYQDIFIQKLDVSGNFVSAISISGPGIDDFNAMCIAPNNKLMLTGIFEKVTDFDGSSGTYTLDAGNNGVISYVAVYDFSLGINWAVKIGTPNTITPNAKVISADANSNCFVSGMFAGVKDFDQGAGTYTMDAAVGNMFIVKLSSTGTFVWAKQIFGYEFVSSTVDMNNNLIVGGVFQNTSDFDPGPGTMTMSATNKDAFLLSLDNSGNFIFAKKFGGSNDEILWSIKTDCNNNIFCSGIFNGTFLADPSSSIPTFTTVADFDAFCLKLDASANFAWAKQISSAGNDYCTSVDVDALGNVYYCGHFSGGNNASSGFVCDFDPGPGTYTLQSAGYSDAYVVKLNASGNFVWAYKAGGTSADAAGSISVNKLFGVHIAGIFWNTVDFDPFAPVYNLVSTVAYDGFVWKFTQANPLLPVVSTSASVLEICSGKSATLSASGQGTISWYASPTATIALGSGSTFVTPALTTNTVYYITGQACNVKSQTVAVNVKVNSLPVLTVSPAQPTLCSGEIFSLTASGAQSYTWNGNTSGNTYTFVTNTSTLVTLLGSDANGCEGTETVNITVAECLGLKNESFKSFSFYPNPNFGLITVACEEPVKLKIFNLNGEVLKTIIVSGSGKTILNLELQPGVYLIKSGENKTLNKLIVIE